MEYASEILDDASQSVKNKLRTIEHKSLTITLGVTRLAKRTKTNMEAQIMLLDLRRQKRTLRAFLKYEHEPEIIRKNKIKRFKNQVSRSLFERAEKILKTIKMPKEEENRDIISIIKELVKYLKKNGLKI